MKAFNGIGRDIVGRRIVTAKLSSRPFNILREQAKLPEPARQNPQGVKIPKAVNNQGNNASPMAGMIRNAHQTMFPMREFSTGVLSKVDLSRSFSSVSKDPERPKSIADLGPSKEVMDNLKKEQVKKREILLIRRAEKDLKKLEKEKDLKEFEEEITSFASRYLKSTQICRRFDVADFIHAMKGGKVESSDEKHERIVRSFSNQNEECKKAMLEKTGHTESDFIEKMTEMEEEKQEKRIIQQALFQYKIETPSEKRPIHAIATTDRYGEFDNEHLRVFGEDIAVFFNRDLLEGISTVVGNDSMTLVSKDHSDSVKIIASPEPLANPTHNIFPLGVKMRINDLLEPLVMPWDPSLHFDNPRSMPIQYFEVHIHRILMEEPLGPRHMTRVVIGNPIDLGEDKAREVKQLCDRNNIPCDVGQNEEDSKQLRLLQDDDHSWIKEVFGE